jgi:hypothetical protein
MDIVQDLSFFMLLFALVYGIYAPCMLVFFEGETSPRQRVTYICSCLLLSWLGYYLSRRYFRSQ